MECPTFPCRSSLTPSVCVRHQDLSSTPTFFRWLHTVLIMLSAQGSGGLHELVLLRERKCPILNRGKSGKCHTSKDLLVGDHNNCKSIGRSLVSVEWDPVPYSSVNYNFLKFVQASNNPGCPFVTSPIIVNILVPSIYNQSRVEFKWQLLLFLQLPPESFQGGSMIECLSTLWSAFLIISIAVRRRTFSKNGPG